jgi:hypothetical protein
MALVIGAYFLMAGRATAPVEGGEEVSVGGYSDTLPAGVSVVDRGGQRILRDERVGYEMEIPEDVTLKNKDGVILFNSTDSGLPVLGGVNTFENVENLSLKDWVYKLHQEKGFLYYEERENIKIGDIDVIKIKVEGEIETYEYFLKKGDKIVGLSFPVNDYFDKFIQSIQIIE